MIGASHPQAQRRVEQAVRLAAGRAPVPAEAREAPQASGLGGLHQAMAAGQLDGYRAAVVAFELEVAPADVADAIVAALGAHLGDDAATLRRRTRVLLSRISPDLVRERAKKARASTGLRRWVAEPGVDEWHGTFPSEDAATAWAAIDRLAHDLVADGTCTSVEQARGKALTDLVTGNATIDIQIVLTVPATAGDPGRDPSRTTASSTPTVEHVDVRTTAESGANDHDGDDDLVEVQGARPSEPLLVRRGWLRDHLTKRPHPSNRRAERLGPQFVPCDPLTGARLDPDSHLATDSYRPGTQLTALVKARDGRCRFPGCSIAARFCDLDHVRPWPTGPTTDTNLLTLCRRHHRTKQRPGWRLRLSTDGTATWTDPTGRERTTTPLDALKSLVLTADVVLDVNAVPEGPATPPADGVTDGPPAQPATASPTWSALETHLQLTLEHHGHPHREPHLWLPPTHRRCTSAADLRAGLARRRAGAAIPDAPPF